MSWLEWVGWPLALLQIGAAPAGGAGLLQWCRCRHAWALVSDKDFPSAVEELHKTGHKLAGQAIEIRWCQRGYAAVLKCDKCGATRMYQAGRV